MLFPYIFSLFAFVESKPVMVLTACGPFTPSDSLAYDPLIDLLTVINRDRPDVCILVRTTAPEHSGEDPIPY